MANEKTKGTADVVQNITASILRVNYNLGLNQVSDVSLYSSKYSLFLCVKLTPESGQTKWTTVTMTNGTKTDINLTGTGIDAPYIDVCPSVPPPLPAPPTNLFERGLTQTQYINTIPNLSTALVALGRSWHREMNRPIHDAIQTLQNTITVSCLNSL
jgi:hypothetical protein